jgi:molybdopterin-guanine dinucleotide biosynthesis protein A
MTAYVLAAAALAPQAAPPPGIDAAAYAQALWQDTYDLLDDLTGVTAYVAAPAPTDLGPTLVVPDGTDAAAALAALHETGATIGAVVAGDAPDLPGLLVGKLFGACEDRPAGVLPASDGRLVGVAARLPLPDWLAGLTLDRDLDWLHQRAPVKAVQIGPGWHRLREPADVARLDPRLDGFWATRALLSGYSA